MKLNKSGKTIVINSWNKYCFTCIKQVKILKKQKKIFPMFIFIVMNKKNEDIAKLLNVKYWDTIIIYKNSKEVAKEIGITKEEEIYSLIKKEI